MSESLDSSLSKCNIHSTAIIEPGAKLGRNVFIGPWCYIGSKVVLRDNVYLHASVIIDGVTELEKNVEVYSFCSIGGPPQDLKYNGELTYCVIGANTVLREGVTINRGTKQGKGITRVGHDCLLMTNAHIAHDCQIGNHVIIVNNVVMGGHVHIGDWARIMGAAAIHQFVNIGKGAVIGGGAGVERDVLPYSSVIGNRARLVGLNWVGLKRLGVSKEEMQMMRHAFRILYPHNNSKKDILEKRISKVREKFGFINKISEMLDFIENPGSRGLIPSRFTNASLKE